MRRVILERSGEGKILLQKPNPVDAHVGRRVRLCRGVIGMSQAKLGAAVGLTFQQIRNYERGAHRIGAGRLYQFGQVLDVPVSFFFDEMPVVKKGTTPPTAEELQKETLAQRETLELVHAYYTIKDREVRSAVLDFLKAAAGPEPDAADEADPKET